MSPGALFMTRGQFPPELAGMRDLDYIPAAGRRLSEYEAVTIYTQPQHGGGGLQTPGEWALRPDGRPFFDLAGTAISCVDWFAFRDPNQMWQRPYYRMQAGAEKSIDVVTEVAIGTGAIAQMAPAWTEVGLQRAYLTYAHVEYGLFRALNVAARESLSDSINNVLAFNAADKLRHAQALILYGMDLEGALPSFDARLGRLCWMEDEMWQPCRRLVEEIMALRDWCEIVVAVNVVVEPLLGQPLRHEVFARSAGRGMDMVSPVIASTAMADWNRNANATERLMAFLAEQPETDNRSCLAAWREDWTDRVRAISATLFDRLESELSNDGLRMRLDSIAEREEQRMSSWWECV
jgi:methane monooxygenase component A beta chain/propane monooxygenase small subunit